MQLECPASKQPINNYLNSHTKLHDPVSFLEPCTEQEIGQQSDTEVYNQKKAVEQIT